MFTTSHGTYRLRMKQRNTMVNCDPLLLNFVLLLACVCWLFSWGLCTEYVVAIDKPPDAFASRACGNVSTESTVQVSCPNNTWFQVVQKVSSSEKFDNCSSSAVPGNNYALSSSKHSPPLVPVCRGRQSFEHDTQLCNESIQVANNVNKSAGVNFFEVKYKCVSDDLVYNMCDDLSKDISANHDLYLASPSFFSLDTAQSPASPGTCSCTLTTTGRLGAVVLYLSLHSPSDNWNMTCDACFTGFTYANNPTVNEDLSCYDTKNQSYSLGIDLRPLPRNNNGSYVRNELWIKFKGDNNISLQCNGFRTTASTPPVSPTTDTTTTTSTRTTASPVNASTTTTTATSSTTEDKADGTTHSDITTSSSLSSTQDSNGTGVAEATTSSSLSASTENITGTGVGESTTSSSLSSTENITGTGVGETTTSSSLSSTETGVAEATTSSSLSASTENITGTGVGETTTSSSLSSTENTNGTGVGENTTSSSLSSTETGVAEATTSSSLSASTENITGTGVGETTTSSSLSSTENTNGTGVGENTTSSSLSSTENPNGTVVAETTTASGDSSTIDVGDRATRSGGLEEWYIYLIAGVVIGVLIIVIVAALIIIRKRSSRKGDAGAAAMREFRSPDGARRTRSQRQRTSSNCCQVDLIDDTGPPPHANGWHASQGRGHCAEDEGRHLHRDGETLSGRREDVSLKPAMDVNANTEPAEDGTGVETSERKNVYFILEPEAGVVKQRGVLFLTDRQGRDLHQHGHDERTKHEDRAGSRSGHHVDDGPRDTDPCFAKVRTVGRSSPHSGKPQFGQAPQEGTDRPVSTHVDDGPKDTDPCYAKVQKVGRLSPPSSKPQFGQASQRKTDRPATYGDYETVDFDSDEGTDRPVSTHVHDGPMDTDPCYAKVQKVGRLSPPSSKPQFGQASQRKTDRPAAYGDYETVDFVSDEGTDRQVSTVHHLDDAPRDTDPCYAKVQKVGRLSPLSGKPQRGQAPQQRTDSSATYGDYETVDFVSDEDSTKAVKLEATSEKSQGQLASVTCVKPDPSSALSAAVPGAGDLDADGDDLIMVDNVVYESADSVLSGFRQTNVETDEVIMVDNEVYESADSVLSGFGQTNFQTDNDNEDGGDNHDDLIMVDNVAYESSASLQHTDSCQTGPGLQPAQWNSANNDDDGGYDDELVMVDNVIYESSASLQHTDSRQADPGPQAAQWNGANGDDDDNDDELVMVDNVIYESSASLQHTDSRQADPGPQAAQWNDANGDDDDSKDDELVMVDNVAYESSASLQYTDSRPPGSGPQPTHKDTSKIDVDKHHDDDDDDVMIDNVAYESADSLSLNSGGESRRRGNKTEPSPDQKRGTRGDEDDTKDNDGDGEYVTIDNNQDIHGEIL